MLEWLTSWKHKAKGPRGRVLGFYEAMKPIHQQLCKQWYYNLSMQSGNQYAAYLGNSQVLQIPSAPDWRVRAVFNEILPLSIVQKLKLMPSNPTITVRPANDLSDEDKANAEMARMLLKAKWKDIEFQDELDDFAGWMVPCTIAYFMTIWDARDGAEIAPGVGIGDAKIIAVSPFEIIPDFTYTRFREMPRYVRATVRDVEWVKHRFGKDVKPQKIDPATVYQLRAQALMTGCSENLNKVLDHHVIVLDMYELPCAEYPTGFHFVCTEQDDLMDAPASMEPYCLNTKEGKQYFLNIDAAQMIRLPGRLIGTNCVEQATPAQCYYNQGQSTILENIKRLSRPKILAPEDKIPAGALAAEDPSQIILEYDSSIEGEITPMKPPEMATYHLDFIRSLPAKIQGAFGIHDASTGVLPRRATSGKAIGHLIGQDDERHFDPKKDVDRAVGGAFRKLLNVCANGYTEQRVRDLIGDDNKITSGTILKGSMLRAADVTITRDVSLPKEASARMDLAMEVLGKNPTGDQIDIMFAIMKADSIESLQAILKSNSSAQEVYAQMENYDMAKGIDRPVAPGEKHQMHIKTHEQLLASPISEAMKLLVMKHISDHRAQEGLENAQKNEMAGEAGSIPEEAEQGPESQQPAAVPAPAEQTVV